MTAAVVEPVHVAGIGELVTSRDPAATLVAYGLGSCVALAAWDPVTRASGLAHFMLPAGAASGCAPVKFVEGGFDHFLEQFRAVGGSPARAQFKAAGGAAMLSVMAGSLDIGRRNADAVVGSLSRAGLRLHASELGGTVGRTVQLSVATGRLHVKSIDSVSVL